MARALNWIIGRLRREPHPDTPAIIAQATNRFGLNLLDEEWLIGQITDHRLAPDSP